MGWQCTSNKRGIIILRFQRGSIQLACGAALIGLTMAACGVAGTGLPDPHATSSLAAKPGRPTNSSSTASSPTSRSVPDSAPADVSVLQPKPPTPISKSTNKPSVISTATVTGTGAPGSASTAPVPGATPTAPAQPTLTQLTAIVPVRPHTTIIKASIPPLPGATVVQQVLPSTVVATPDSGQTQTLLAGLKAIDPSLANDKAVGRARSVCQEMARGYYGGNDGLSSYVQQDFQDPNSPNVSKGTAQQIITLIQTGGWC